jgi:hypothetical protein
MPLERFFQVDTISDISQHRIVRLFQARQQLSDLCQFLFGNDHDPLLGFVQHSEIARSYGHTAYLDWNIRSPWFGLERSPDSRQALAPDREIPICTELAAANCVSHSAVDYGSHDSSDFETSGDDVAQ